jgi:hypothetical protein
MPMSINHQLDAPANQPPPEHSSFKAVESHANSAFQSEVQKDAQSPGKSADSKGAESKSADADSKDLGLPRVHLIGSEQAARLDKPMQPKGGDQALDPNTPRIGDDLNGRIVKAIGANEGVLTHITKNDAGHGISVGIRQWNQKTGELPNLLKEMHDKNPQKFDDTFGPYAKNLQNEHYVRRADMAHNPDLMKRMGNALKDPEFQKVQIDDARNFAQKSIDTAQKYGLHSEKGAALVADITNQMGEGGARKALAHAGLRPGGTVKNEEQALQRLEHATHRPNSRDRFNTIASNFNGANPIRKPLINDNSMALA